MKWSHTISPFPRSNPNSKRRTEIEVEYPESLVPKLNTFINSKWKNRTCHYTLSLLYYVFSF